LIYMLLTRHDIQFAVSRVCSHMHRNGDIHWQAAKRILRYLQGKLTNGTSGCGKTRGILEFLSHHYGFYFLAMKSELNPGFSDMNSIVGYLGDLLRPAGKGGQTDYVIVRQHLDILILVRIKVFQFLIDTMLRKPTPYEWMMAQLHPDFVWRRYI